MEKQKQMQSDSSEILKNLSYQESMNKIILTYSIYYKIFEKYYLEGTDVSRDLNRIYQPIFIGLMECYSEFMTEGIKQIILNINLKYMPEKPYAIIDYIEFLFGNVFYETFLSEIKKINSNKIGYEHLCVFEYIVRVELIKYDLYSETLKKIDPDTKIILAIKHRIVNCVRKMSFCLSWLKKNYPTQQDIFNLCLSFISESESYSDIINKIELESVENIDSFMKINKK
jgi:hypothetical protein